MAAQLQTTYPPVELSKEELDAYTNMAEQSCREYMAKREAEWGPQGKIFAWFSKEPHWAEGCLSWFWLEDPKGPCERIFRFTLIGGGQVKTTERWEWHSWIGGRAEDTPRACFTWRDDDTYLSHTKPTRITVSPHTSQGVHRYHGIIDTYHSDVSASAVIFGGNVPQEIAGRTAATLRLTSIPSGEPFYALLDGSEGCAICGRALRDEVSKLVGVGPDCAHQNNIPHSMKAASKRLELRRKLLGEMPGDPRREPEDDAESDHPETRGGDRMEETQ